MGNVQNMFNTFPADFWDFQVCIGVTVAIYVKEKGQLKGKAFKGNKNTTLLARLV